MNHVQKKLNCKHFFLKKDTTGQSFNYFLAHEGRL